MTPRLPGSDIDSISESDSAEELASNDVREEEAPRIIELKKSVEGMKVSEESRCRPHHLL